MVGSTAVLPIDVATEATTPCLDLSHAGGIMVTDESVVLATMYNAVFAARW